MVRVSREGEDEGNTKHTQNTHISIHLSFTKVEFLLEGGYLDQSLWTLALSPSPDSPAFPVFPKQIPMEPQSSTADYGICSTLKIARAASSRLDQEMTGIFLGGGAQHNI